MSEDGQESGEVIADIGSGSGRVYQPPVVRAPRFGVVDGGRCRHRRAIVDETLRRVTCHTCGETLDPVQVLIEIAQRYEVRERQAEAQARREADAWEKARERDRYAEERRRAVEKRFPDGYSILLSPAMGEVAHRFFVASRALCGNGMLPSMPADRPSAKPECRNCERSKGRVVVQDHVVWMPIRFGPVSPPFERTIVSERGTEVVRPRPELTR